MKLRVVNSISCQELCSYSLPLAIEKFIEPIVELLWQTFTFMIMSASLPCLMTDHRKSS